MTLSATLATRLPQHEVKKAIAMRLQPDQSGGVDGWVRRVACIAVQDKDWIESVGARPIGERPFGGSTVAGIEFPLRQWDGAIGGWSEHFGKAGKQVHSLDGEEPLRSCQEVEVAKRLREARDHAFWFSGYNAAKVPAIWRPWVRTLDLAPAWLRSLNTAIRQRISSPKGGMPDVVAWNDLDSLGSAVFIECKGRGESFKEAQEDWVWAALKAGIRPTQIAVAVLPF